LYPGKTLSIKGKREWKVDQDRTVVHGQTPITQADVALATQVERGNSPTKANCKEIIVALTLPKQIRMILPVQC